MRDPDDPDSIARLITGDPHAFDELYKFLAEWLRLFIKNKYGRLGLTFQDAEEIVNDALLEAHKNITTFRPGERSLKTYIFELARWKAVDRLRKRSRVNKRDALDDVGKGNVLPLEHLTDENHASLIKTDAPDFVTAVEEAEHATIFLAEVDKLPPNERDALRYAGIYKDEQIAFMHNTTAGSIRTARHRAAKKVRDALARYKNS